MDLRPHRGAPLRALALTAFTALGLVAGTPTTSVLKPPTVPTGWHKPFNVEQPGEAVWSPDAVLDGAGHGYAYWRPGGQNALQGFFVRRFAVPSGIDGVATGWEGTVRLGDMAAAVQDLHLAAHPDGSATVVWSQANANSGRDLWFLRYEVQTGWTRAQRLPNVSQAYQFRLAASGRDAVVVWCENNAVKSARYDAVAGGWQGPGVVSGGTTDTWIDTSSEGFRIVPGPGGCLLASWAETVQGSSLGRHVAYRYYQPTAGWSWRGDLGSGSRYVQGAIDASGAATLLWRDPNTGVQFRHQLRARRIDLATGSGTDSTLPGPATLVTDGDQAQVAMDGTGAALAMWSDPNQGMWFSELQPNPAVPGAWAWSNPAPSPVAVGEDANLRLAMGGRGTILAMWMRPQPSWLDQGLFTASHTRDKGWDAGHYLENSDTYPEDPLLAADPSGNAVAVWMRAGDVSPGVWADFFIATNPVRQ